MKNNSLKRRVNDMKKHKKVRMALNLNNENKSLTCSRYWFEQGLELRHELELINVLLNNKDLLTVKWWEN